jgi:hypothetical protein
MRCLIFLALLAVVPKYGHFSSIQLPIYRTLQAEHVIDDTGYRYESVDEYYVFQLTVGSPPQKLNLTLDTQTDKTLFFDSTFKDIPCANYTDGYRRLFAHKASSTFGGWYPELIYNGMTAYATNRNIQCVNRSNPNLGEILGYYAADTFGFGSFVGFYAMEIPFFLVTQFNGSLDSHWQSDGVLGITPYVDGREMTAIQLIASQVGHPAVSLWFDRSVADDQYATQTEAGYFTIGDRDKKNCNDDWVYFDMATNDVMNFNIPLTSIAFGTLHEENITLFYGPNNKDYLTLWMNTASPYLTLDTDFFNRIVYQINAEKDTLTGDLYVVKCSDVKNLPDIVYTLNSTDGTPYVLRVAATDYARNLIPRNDDKCTLLIIKTDSPSYKFSNQPWFTMVSTGTTAARAHCWYMEFDTGRMGIATAKVGNSNKSY